MFSRSSSSSMRRRTYGLDVTDRAASPALALLLCAPMGLLSSFSRVQSADYPVADFPSRPRSAPVPAPSIGLERGLQDVSDVVRVDEVEPLALLIRDLFDVALVSVRHDHLLDPGPLGRERLLLEA